MRIHAFFANAGIILFLVFSNASQAEAACNSIPDDIPHAVSETARSSVVRIRAVLSMPNGAVRSGGSGFLVSRKGHVLTAAHVIKDFYRLQKEGRDVAYHVTFSDCRTAQATVLVAGEHAFYGDVALLKIVGSSRDFVPVRLGKVRDVREGDRVYAIGSPYGNVNVVVQGELTSKMAYNPEHSPYFLFYATTPVNLGNSGGALAARDGRVFGLTTGCDAIDAGPAGKVCIRNGYFVPVNIVRKWLKFWKLTGTIRSGWRPLPEK